jgi:hypothetical protein
LGGPSDIPPTTGNRYYVDSGATNSSNNNTGLDSGEPLATLAGAIAKCTANQGDQIILKAGHAENLTADVSISTAGVSIFGLGEANIRPIFSYTGTAGAISFDAANCRLSNVVLTAGVAEVVLAIDVQANYARIDHCTFNFDATGDEFDTCIDVQGFDWCQIDNNDFRTEIGSSADNCLNLEAAEQIKILNNNFTGTWNVVITNAATASVQMEIGNNTIYNSDTTDNNGIEITVASTGICYNNYINTLHATVASHLDPGSLLCTENYSTDAVDTTGILIPAATGD